MFIYGKLKFEKSLKLRVELSFKRLGISAIFRIILGLNLLKLMRLQLNLDGITMFIFLQNVLLNIMILKFQREYLLKLII